MTFYYYFKNEKQLKKIEISMKKKIKATKVIFIVVIILKKIFSYLFVG